MGVDQEEVVLDTQAVDHLEEFTAVAIDGLKHSGAPQSSDTAEKDLFLHLCRVCHCTEPDLQGDAALGFLGIVPPSQGLQYGAADDCMDPDNFDNKGDINPKNCAETHASDEIVNSQCKSPVCNADIESGSNHPEGSLIFLGCSCKNELALAHYACALKWFINHGSTICEICGNNADNVRLSDLTKVLASLKDYDDLRRRGPTGEISTLRDGTSVDLELDGSAEIRRRRLTEISSWFHIHNSQVAISQGQIEQLSAAQAANMAENMSATERENIERAIRNTGVFIAVGLFMVLIAWLLAPHFGKRGALIVFHLLLGGAAALVAILFLRLIMPGLRYGETRYWGILFIFWFLVLGVWSSQTYNIRKA